MENPENPSELEDLKTIYKWIKKNNKFLTLSTFAILFCWYLNPVIRESKFKNMCAYNTTNISLENTDKKNNWKLILKYHFGGYAKTSRDLDVFVDSFNRHYPFNIEPIYTGKVMFAMQAFLAKIKGNKKALFVHTGGLYNI